MSLADYVSKRVLSRLRWRAESFVNREAVRKLLHDFPNGGSPRDSVIGTDLDLLRSLATIRAVLPRIPEVLIDIGAHKGAFTRAAMRMLGFQQAICVEPDADLNSSLRRDLEPASVIIRNVALSDHAGKQSLFIHPVKAMNSLAHADGAVIREKFRYDPNAIVERTVDVDTLDNILGQSRIANGSRYFIKLDTQGNEMDVLRGATDTLRRTDGCLVEFMFCTPYERKESFYDFMNFMNDHGFDCCGALTVMRRPSHEISGVDFLFVSRNASVQPRTTST